LLVIEESSGALGWGAEVAAQAAERYGSSLLSIRRMAGRSIPVPASPRLEYSALPQLDDILVKVKSMLLGRL
jgi:pyruvate/2-oxoglutarate/acetoin dehydrogenase E1 component